MRRRFSICFFLTLSFASCAGLSLAPNRAFAEESAASRRATAQQLYEEGVRAFEAGDYAGALAGLQRSYELFPSLRTLFSIGMCQYSLSQLTRAHRSLTTYLREGGEQVPRELREQASALLVEMNERLALVTLEVNLDGATVTIDDEPFGTSPLPDDIALEPGRHSIEASLAGHQPLHRVVILSARTAITIQLDFAEQESTDENSGAPSSGAGVQLPDVVMLRDGSFIRGTISVMVPNSHVLLITATGEPRRFDMAEVVFAGRAEEMPSPDSYPPQPPVETTPPITVHLVGDGVNFHRMVSISRGPISRQRYTLVCAAPCDAQMEPGAQSFALSHRQSSQIFGRMLYVEQPITVSDGMTLIGRITDNRPHRRTGAALVAVGGVVGLGLIISAFATSIDLSLDYGLEEDEGSSFNHRFFWPFFLTGTLTLVLFETIGIRLLRRRDVASISSEPPRQAP